MTGVLSAAVGSGPLVSTEFTITVADGGAGAYGFQNGTFGATSPASFRGVTIGHIWSTDAGDLSVRLNSTSITQGYFSYILVVDGTGATRFYSSSTATYSVGSFTQWSWGTGSNKVWTAAHGSRTAKFVT